MVLLADALDQLLAEGPEAFRRSLAVLNTSYPSIASELRVAHPGPTELQPAEAVAFVKALSQVCREVAVEALATDYDLANTTDELEYLPNEALRRGGRFILGLDEPRAPVHVKSLVAAYASALPTS